MPAAAFDALRSPSTLNAGPLFCVAATSRAAARGYSTKKADRQGRYPLRCAPEKSENESAFVERSGKTKTLEEILDELPPERRKKVEARAAQLIAEEATLQELRKAHRKTQTQVARKLHMTPGQVSQLEQRSDLLLSTLRKVVEGMGGQLSLIAEFPAHNPVKLDGLSALDSVISPRLPVRSASPRSAAKGRRSRLAS
jgi:hypothetical protein